MHIVPALAELLSQLALQRGLCLKGWKWVAFSLGCVLLYALSDEFHQSFVPGRNPRLIDVSIDLLGAALGIVLNDAVTCGKV